MKTILILLLLSLGACHKDSPEPVYTDITGTWTFSGSVAGEIQVINPKAPESVAGFFEVDGKRHTLVTHWRSNFPDDLSIVEDEDHSYLIFHDFKVTPDYKTMTSSYYEWKTTSGSGTKTETINFKRK